MADVAAAKGEDGTAVAAVLTALSQVVPGDRCVAWADLSPEQRDRYGRALDAPAAAVVYPETPEELTATIALAWEQGWPWLPCGRGSKLAWGQRATGVRLVVSCQRLNPLIDHAVGDLTVTAAAGMRLADLQDLLRPTGQFLPVDPLFPDTATLGGIVATGDQGALRQRYGTLRDLLLGIEFARQDGAIARAGGRVVKNVAGYDLMKLHTGAYGSLGAIAAVTLRTYPIPDTWQTVVVVGDLADLDRLARTLRRSTLTPIAADWISGASLLSEVAAEVGTDWDAPPAAALAVRFASVAASVTAQVQQIQDWAAAAKLNTVTLTDAAEGELWATWQAARSLASEGSLLLRLGMLPTAVPEAIAQIQATCPTAAIQIRAGSGTGQAQLPLGFNLLDTNKAIAQLQQLRDICQHAEGFVTVLSAPPSFPADGDRWGYPGNAIAVMHKIKQQFDCKSLIAPGRFVV
jgi:glycolate oxidase FAD binding subunit